MQTLSTSCRSRGFEELEQEILLVCSGSGPSRLRPSLPSILEEEGRRASSSPLASLSSSSSSSLPPSFEAYHHVAETKAHTSRSKKKKGNEPPSNNHRMKKASTNQRKKAKKKKTKQQHRRTSDSTVDASTTHSTVNTDTSMSSCCVVFGLETGGPNPSAAETAAVVSTTNHVPKDNIMHTSTSTEVPQKMKTKKKKRKTKTQGKKNRKTTASTFVEECTPLKKTHSQDGGTAPTTAMRERMMTSVETKRVRRLERPGTTGEKGKERPQKKQQDRKRNDKVAVAVTVEPTNETSPQQSSSKTKKKTKKKKKQDTIKADETVVASNNAESETVRLAGALRTALPLPPMLESSLSSSSNASPQSGVFKQLKPSTPSSSGPPGNTDKYTSWRPLLWAHHLSRSSSLQALSYNMATATQQEGSNASWFGSSSTRSMAKKDPAWYVISNRDLSCTIDSRKDQSMEMVFFDSTATDND